MNIGIIGYSIQKFNEKKAREMINNIYDSFEKHIDNLVIVSGLTDLGIPKIAYEEAVKRNYKTIGIACQKAKEYELFPVDEKIIIGEEWGDESNTFLKYIDILIKIGGGEQSKKEVEQAKENGIKVYEFKLNPIEEKEEE